MFNPARNRMNLPVPCGGLCFHDFAACAHAGYTIPAEQAVPGTPDQKAGKLPVPAGPVKETVISCMGQVHATDGS